MAERGLSVSSTNVYGHLRSLQNRLSPNVKLNMHQGPWFAGGSVLRLFLGQNLESSDIDVFFSNESDFKHLYDVMNSIKQSKEDQMSEPDTTLIIDPYAFNLLARKKPTYKTKFAFTYELSDKKVQLIRREMYNNVAELFGDFDFTVCQFATDCELIAYTDLAFEDALAKQLRIVNMQKNSTFTRRFFKYLAYGYTPRPGMASVIQEIVRNDIDRYCSAEGNYTHVL
ncbi:MAG: hypothetical protein HC836_16515 [Richelia sp. RM2_1_2]|nr:hypothetical protein [Richelia sp. RM2_1_2]